MSYLHHISTHARSLPLAFDTIAHSAMHDAHQRAKPSGKAAEEPDFIASLVKHGVPDIHKTLVDAFAGTGINVSTTGVFCHQSPMVKFLHGSTYARCELGDILFVHVHRDRDGVVQRNALLLQAKMTKPAAAMKTIPAAEQHQLFLYKTWPRFNYDMKGDSLHGKCRTVIPNTRHAGAQYLLIDADPRFARFSLSAGDYPMAVWMAENPLYTNITLGQSLFDFLKMSVGLSFSAKRGARGWSAVVWDLLDNGLKKGFTRKRTGHISTPGSRLSGPQIPAYACFSMRSGLMEQSIVADVLGDHPLRLTPSNNDGSLPPDILVEADVANPNSGVSLILIETDESQLLQAVYMGADG